MSPCPACGAAPRPDARFCAACGHPLGLAPDDPRLADLRAAAQGALAAARATLHARLAALRATLPERLAALPPEALRAGPGPLDAEVDAVSTAVGATWAEHLGAALRAHPDPAMRALAERVGPAPHARAGAPPPRPYRERPVDLGPGVLAAAGVAALLSGGALGVLGGVGFLVGAWETRKRLLRTFEDGLRRDLGEAVEGWLAAAEPALAEGLERRHQEALAALTAALNRPMPVGGEPG